MYIPSLLSRSALALQRSAGLPTVRRIWCAHDMKSYLHATSSNKQYYYKKQAGSSIKAICDSHSIERQYHCQWPLSVKGRNFSKDSISHTDSEIHDSTSSIRDEPENDEELTALLKEISSDFDHGKKEIRVTDSEDNPPLENENTHTSNTFDIDQELLRYDYEEFEEPSEHDIDEELDGYDDSEIRSVEYKRGITGVFDIEELVESLKEENAQEICVIRVPKEMQYVDYMVITSGRSTRHLKAIGSHIQWLHKKKRGKHDPAYVKVEGMKMCSDWFALDLGNIAVHLFLPETRKMYDLETLWTVGADFDYKDTVEKSTDPFDMFLNMGNYEDWDSSNNISQSLKKKMDNRNSFENTAGYHNINH